MTIKTYYDNNIPFVFASDFIYPGLRNGLILTDVPNILKGSRSASEHVLRISTCLTTHFCLGRWCWPNPRTPPSAMAGPAQ
jgi:hypothetical protein